MIRLASLGTSAITARTVAAAASVADLRFTTVCGRDPDRAAALAAAIGVGASTGDFPGLLADPDIDAVYVATPNALHADQIRRALIAGKHVFCEKPATASASEWDELCALAASGGLVLLENMRTAYDPVMLRIVELVPTLGTLRRVSFSLSQRSSRYDDVLAGRAVNIFDPALGGGALADLGVYLTHPLVRLLGAPDRVRASLIQLSTGADGAGAALLDYPGLVAEVAWSKIAAGRLGGSIEGEDGTITIDHLTELHSITVDYRAGRQFVERPDKEPDNITYALRRFAELIGSGTPDAPDQAWTRDSIALLDAIRQAGS